jgi:hypothetical protein
MAIAQLVVAAVVETWLDKMVVAVAVQALIGLMEALL